MEVVILAAGRNTRLKLNFLEKTFKPLVSVGDQKLIEYSLNNAVKINAKKINIIVRSNNTDIQGHYGDSYSSIPINYIIDNNPSGLVSSFSKYIYNNENILLSLSDEIFIKSIHENLSNTFLNSDIDILIGIERVRNISDVQKTYGFNIDLKTGNLSKFIEKPDFPVNQFRGTGNIFFKNTALKKLGIENKGFEELVDILNYATELGLKVQGHEICEKYFNINTEDDYNEANKYLCTN